MSESTKPLFSQVQTETRTSATVFDEDLQMFKGLARLKFPKDPMNNAWKEAVKLFICENKHLLQEKFDIVEEKSK